MTKKHVLIMLLCCLVPVLAMAAIVLFGVPLSSVFWFVIILLCPVSHIVMMRLMMQDEYHHAVTHPSHFTKREKAEFKLHLPQE